MTNFLNRIALATLASAGLFALPTLTITNVADSSFVTIADGGIGDGDGLANGQIVYSNSAAFGNLWNISVTSGLTKPQIGSATLPAMNLNSTIVKKSASAGSLLFNFIESGFTGNPYAGSLTGQISSIKSAGSLNVSSTLNSVAYNNLAPINYTKNSSSAMFNTTGPAVSPIGPYTLGLSYQINVNAGVNSGDTNRQANANASLSSVPEPGFYGTVAIGLSGLFVVVNRRRSKTAA